MDELKKMTKEELLAKFESMFPNYAPFVKEIKKTGARCLSIQLNASPHLHKLAGHSIVFMYINEWDWHLGTKLYRKAPTEFLKRHEKRMNKED